jgi:uncharacterized membrane protein YphA (DoxX/SURF4 family)
VIRGQVAGLVRGWDSFWFTSESTATLALLRIAFGVVMIAWTLSLTPDLTAFYSEVGLVPEQPRWVTPITLLGFWDSPLAVVALWLVMLVASVCLVLGYQARLAAVLVFVALLSFQRRSPDTINSGDILLRLIALYLALAPSGAALSLDRWRSHRDTFWRFPMRSRWPLRLIQVQVSILYLASVFNKAMSDAWTDGTAFGLIMRIEDVRRLPVPDVVTDQLLLVNLLTFGTLAVELALAVLIWNRRALQWVLAAGVALHLGIELTMTLGFFSIAMLVSYVAFIPPERAEQFIMAVARRVGRVGGAEIARGALPRPAD